MSEEDEGDKPDEVQPPQPGLVLIDSTSIPDGEATTAEEWVQRATLVTEQLLELAKGMYVSLWRHAPVLYHTDVGDMLMGIGSTLDRLHQSGQLFLGRHSIPPLDFVAEQRRIIASVLANPEVTPEETERMATYTAMLDEQEARAAAGDWDAFVGTESKEVN